MPSNPCLSGFSECYDLFLLTFLLFDFSWAKLCQTNRVCMRFRSKLYIQSIKATKIKEILEGMRIKKTLWNIKELEKKPLTKKTEPLLLRSCAFELHEKKKWISLLFVNKEQFTSQVINRNYWKRKLSVGMLKTSDWRYLNSIWTNNTIPFYSAFIPFRWMAFSG